MLAYVTLGSNDTKRACAFYDALMPLLGAKRLFDNGKLYFYGLGPDKPLFGIGTPHDGEAAGCGNGAMVALAAADTRTVDLVHDKALELGAQDEGKPGHRMPTFYGAYFRDPDGHKICVCKIG